MATRGVRQPPIWDWPETRSRRDDVQRQDQPARLARGRRRAGADERDYHRQERAQPENEADQNQGQDLRIGAEVLDHPVH